LPLPENQLTEILISRDQHACRNPALHQDDLIHHRGRQLGYIRNLITIKAKAFDNLAVAALIGEKRHRETVSRG
jgi:hypothetical protein